MIEKCTPYDVVVIGSGGGRSESCDQCGRRGSQSTYHSKGKNKPQRLNAAGRGQYKRRHCVRWRQSV